MPPVQLGIIRFNHKYSVICPLSSNRDEIRKRLTEMEFEPGETKLAPPLTQAQSMLKESRFTQEGTVPRQQAVIVISDGDPNDLAASESAAAALKDAGVLLIFVQVGEGADPHVMWRLASEPKDKYVLKVDNYDALLNAASSLLRSVVRVSQWVKKIKCLSDLTSCTEVEDISQYPGYEILVPGWEFADDCWQWRPNEHVCIHGPRTLNWEPDVKSLSQVQVDANVVVRTGEAKIVQEDGITVSLLGEQAPKSPNRMGAGDGAVLSAMAASKNYEGMVVWLKIYFCKQYGDLTVAFHQIADSMSHIITVTKLAKALSDHGVSRHVTEALFKKLVELAHCEMCGFLVLQDWLKAFSAIGNIQESAHAENPLLSSLNYVCSPAR